jgi:hypothetical protein
MFSFVCGDEIQDRFNHRSIRRVQNIQGNIRFKNLPLLLQFFSIASSRIDIDRLGPNRLAIGQHHDQEEDNDGDRDRHRPPEDIRPRSSGN